MNIGIAKIGQKVFFNRNAKEVKRSNTNGNFGCYRLLSLLFELNKKDTFYFFSKNDLCIGSYDNVFPFVANPKDLDCIILIPGLVLSEDDVYTLNEISNCKCKLVILSDDPRCLRETLKNLKDQILLVCKIMILFIGIVKFLMDFMYLWKWLKTINSKGQFIFINNLILLLLLMILEIDTIGLKF